MKVCFLLIFAIAITACTPEKKEASVKGLNLPEERKKTLLTVDFNGLEPYLNKADNKTYIVNFWATWCKPCVEELPYFEQAGKKYRDQNVEVLLVSLDFPTQVEKQLKPFIEKNKLNSQVILLNDPDQNSWISKVDSSWTGAIPATLIYNKSKRTFYETSFTWETLEKELNNFLKPLP